MYQTTRSPESLLTQEARPTSFSEIKKGTIELTGFNGVTTPSMGVTPFWVKASGLKKLVKFTVLDCLSPYNILIGKPWIHAIRAVPSSLHQCICFPTTNGIGEVRGSQKAARNCYMTSHKLKKSEPEDEQWQLLNVEPVKEANSAESNEVENLNEQDSPGIEMMVQVQLDGSDATSASE